ncbi:MAG: HAD-IA family hydrolase [Desulfobacterales bacterium]|nr:HAD-IA family hydrolase [Desulfobacterales bacterium]
MNTRHRRICAVVFDFDGTLTRPGALDFPAIKRALGCPIDRPVLEFIDHLADADQRAEAHTALDRFEADAAALSEPALGAERLLRFLKARRVPAAILTRNSRASVLRALTNFNGIVPTDFAAIISRDDPVAPKPSPDGVFLAAERLGVSPEESLVVGDFVFDIQAGQAAGAMTALIAPDGVDSDSAGWDSDVCVPGLDDLVDIVRMHLPLAAGKFPADLLEGFFKAFTRPDPSVLIASAVGEDTAAVSVAGEEVLILKSDPITFATDAIGDYAVVVNANDIATAGATPRWLLTTILFPCGITTAAALAVMEQLHRACGRWQITLCGGHTEITDAVTRTVVIGMMAGTVSRSRLIDKSAISAGDRVLLTKALAVEGTTIIAREFGDRLKASGMCDQDIKTCHHLLSELSIIEEAGIATRSGKVTGMHDVTEGGIATALEELSAAAGHRIRVEIDRIPIMDLCRTVCDRLGINPLGLIGSGSLLICCRPESAGPIMAAVSNAGIAITEIGTVTSPGRGMDAFDKGVPTHWPRFAVDEITRLFKPQ